VQDIHDLMIFAKVVATGSMSAAGRAMGLSPAVVSKRIRRLEEGLGTLLLQRTTRQIALTEAGQGFHERIVQILTQIEEAEAFVSRRSAQAQGTLKISAPTTFGRLHVAPYLGAFLEKNRGLTINLVLSDEFVDVVGEGFDLAIRIGALADSSLVVRRLAPNHRFLCAAPAYLERHGTPQRLSDLDAHVCLAAAHQDPWRLEGPNGEVAVHASAAVQTNSSEVVRELCLSGVGIALRSTWDVGPELSSGRLKVVLPEFRGSRHVAVHAVYPSRRFLPAKVRLFIDYLAGLYGPKPYWDAGLEILDGRPDAAE
jgi:DNA-binding transcriptional LysR family regulator